MNPAINNATVYDLPIYPGTTGGIGAAGFPTSFAASAGGSTADIVAGALDRFRLSRRYRSVKVVVPYDVTTPAVGAKLLFNVGIQDAVGATGPWADVVGAIIGSTGTRTQIIVGPTVTSSAGWTFGCVHADFNLQPARRYVRAVYNADLAAATSSGLIMQNPAPMLLLSGGEEQPVDANFRTCST